jgi:glutamate synthase domain-containing protein 1
MATNRTLPFKDMGGCSISGIMDQSGQRFTGDVVLRSIANMHERSNGLGGGFAAYGIYPDRADQYCMQLMFDSPEARDETEALVEERAVVHHAEPIPTRPNERISDEPLLHRYFVNIDLD